MCASASVYATERHVRHADANNNTSPAVRQRATAANESRAEDRMADSVRRRCYRSLVVSGKTGKSGTSSHQPASQLASQCAFTCRRVAFSTYTLYSTHPGSFVCACMCVSEIVCESVCSSVSARGGAEVVRR